jgi:molybdopterin-guanine dinucleotide biosynthesis protein
MNRQRPKQIVIRASEQEFAKIKSKVEKSKLNQNEYLLKSCLDKNIVVVEGFPDLTIELKRIGNNLNQLTRAVHEGKANCNAELAEIEKELSEVWQLLRQLARGQV